MLHLASRSPRRRQLLEQLGYEFELLDVDVPEQRLRGEPAQDYVSRVAREKAGVGLLQVAGDAAAVVLGADTEVVLDDDVFGKPRDTDDAAAMLRRLSGRTHNVISVVWLLNSAREEHAVSLSQVRITALSSRQIDAYVASGEALGKAGAYAIQGRAAGFIEHLSGSHSAVMGLPLFETARLLDGFGIRAKA